MQDIYLIHCWGGNQNSDWYPWLKKELSKHNLNLNILEMPNTDSPNPKEWIPYIQKNVNPNNAVFIGHSVGCQAILRYLAILNKNIKVKACILVAGWTKLKPIVYEQEGALDIAKPWLTPIDWNKAKTHCDNFIYIYSNNDPYVYESDSLIFKDKLKAKLILIKNKFHFGGGDESNITKLDEVLNEILKIKI